MKHEPLVFTLEREEIPVTIDSQEYVLQELDGAERDKYLNGLTNRMRVNNKGDLAGIKNFDGLQASLVVASIRLVDGVERKPVPFKTVQEWPAKVVKQLFDAARAISGLDDEDEKDKEKTNDGGGEDGGEEGND